MKSDFSTFERRIQIIAILINQNIVKRNCRIMAHDFTNYFFMWYGKRST